MRLSYAIVALLAFHETAHGADAADALAKLDTNGNYMVEEAEAQAGGRKLFADLDKNGDGLLQPEELNAAVLKAADPDADGALNPQEYAALITARYKSANVNSDGLVDGAELGSLAGQLLVIMVFP